MWRAPGTFWDARAARQVAIIAACRVERSRMFVRRLSLPREHSTAYIKRHNQTELVSTESVPYRDVSSFICHFVILQYTV